jgi:fatty-acid peroxygenase
MRCGASTRSRRSSVAAPSRTWHDERIPAGSLILLDIFGQDHDAALWPEPYRFRPQRFLHRDPDPDELIPQGGADPRAGHRCPGEDITIALLAAFATWLARLDYDVPQQDLMISLHRVPAIVQSRFVIGAVRRAASQQHGDNARPQHDRV